MVQITKPNPQKNGRKVPASRSMALKSCFSESWPVLFSAVLDLWKPLEAINGVQKWWINPKRMGT